MKDDAREFLQELRENWNDPYWRADHPEVLAVMVAVVTGILGLVFTLIDLLMRRSLA